jgi:hypothetical protein
MATRIITPPGIVSYCFVLEAREDLNGNLKYSTSILFDKDKTDMSAIEAAVDQAAKAKFGNKPPKNLRNPIRDGDTERDDPAYENKWFMNCSSNRRPGIVDHVTGDVVDNDDEDIGIYSGCTCRLSVAFFGYDQQGNKGVGVGLNNIEVIKRGDRMDGTVSAQDDFKKAGKIDLDAL